MNSILYVTEYAGFIGGIERYAASSAVVLRKNHHVDLFYLNKGMDFEKFRTAFDNVTDTMPSVRYDHVIIHKLSDPDILETLLARYGDAVTLFVHDHDPYCPRSYYYTPCGRKNCSRKYSFPTCSLCAMTRNVTRFKDGFFAELKRKTFTFKRYYELMHKVSRFIVLSKFMKNNLVRNGITKDSISVIPPFAVRCSPVKRANTIPVIGFMGQLIMGKGPDTFLEMLTLLKSKYKAVVIGDGNMREKLEEYAGEYALNVEFKGYVPNVENELSDIDFFVFPFRWQEPFGLVGIEAAASGIPVIAYETGGVRQWLRDGFNGLTVSVGCIEELALAAERLLTNPYLRREMGKNGMTLGATIFSEENYIALMNEFLKAGKNGKR